MSFENFNLNNKSCRFRQNDFKREQIFNPEITSDIIKNIEKAKINIDEKINLILTKGGLKPASEITLIIKTRHKNGLTTHMSEQDIQDVLDIIQSLKLPHRFGKRETLKEAYSTKDNPDKQEFFYRDQMNILVGRSPKDLEFLEYALKSNSDKIRGDAFGLPSTAIDAFIGKKEKLDRQSLPLDIQCSDGILFSSPTLSRDGWEEEIKQGQLYGSFIQKLSPELYKAMKSKMFELFKNG